MVKFTVQSCSMLVLNMDLTSKGQKVYRNYRPLNLVVQFVAESRFANYEFANLFFDFDELHFS